MTYLNKENKCTKLQYVRRVLTATLEELCVENHKNYKRMILPASHRCDLE